MHWLASEIDRLRALSRAHRDAREGGTPDEKRAREAFHAAVRTLVDEVAAHPGVDAAFAAYEGLLLAAGGREQGLEAMAAMSQLCVEPARDAARTLSLGRLRQVLLVGEHEKLALVEVDDLTLGIVSPEETRLASALAVGSGLDA